jgi:hypothetical protein
MRPLFIMVVAGVLTASCGADRSGAPATLLLDASASSAVASPLTPSLPAAARIEEVRSRFRFHDPSAGAVVRDAVATRFEVAVGDGSATRIRPIMSATAARGARVALPVHANDPVELEDATSHLSVAFSLDHAQATQVEVDGGMAIYRGALAGADVLHRVHAEGTEDFVVFEARPEREELSYSVDVSKVAGLRLVSNTLEFLDPTGTPLLRIAPPYVMDATGTLHAARLGVDECGYDVNPAGPWGREVTAPAADRCTVRVTWSGVAYPAIVDPAWGATGSLAVGRTRHTANLLLSGKVLIVGGGGNAGTLASAELYDPSGNGGGGTFAATGSMATPRQYHAASALPSGKVLLLGGENASCAVLATAELYDPSAGTFSATGSLALGRRYITSTTLLSGKVLVAGGHTCVSPYFINNAEVFDPNANSGVGGFTTSGTMASSRYFHAQTRLASGKVLITGGGYATAELFDPAGNAGAGSFATTGAMSTDRSFHTATLLASGKVLVAGGQLASNYLSTAEVFDPAANAGAGAFSATGSLTARAHHAANLLPSGKVLLAGGQTSGYLTSAELFDPAGNAGAGTFAATASLLAPRTDQSETLLPSGRVLAVAGYNGTFLATAELYGGALGDGCAVDDDCLSRHCVDGMCCTSACNLGGCDRCDLSGKIGTCTIAPAGNPGAKPACAFPLACDGVNAACPAACATDAGCAAGYYCAAAGTCQLRKAQAASCNPQVDCKDATCQECTSGFCTDGVCCDKACSGQCEACDSVAGVCGSITGKPHGSRAACEPGKACGTSTNGCESAAASCDGDHIAKAADGTTKDCAPYKCESNGTCRPSTCTSVNDCVAPAVCNQNGECAAPATDPGGSGGCSVSTSAPTTRDTTALPIAFLCTLAALIRRRRRRPTP